MCPLYAILFDRNDYCYAKSIIESQLCARDWLVCNHISLKYSKALEAKGNNRANEQN